MQAADTTLAISRPSDPNGALPDSSIEPENPESKEYAASITFLETHMTNQETLPNMDTGLVDSDWWWDFLRAAPTPLVGNATFLKNSSSPILPQW